MNPLQQCLDNPVNNNTDNTDLLKAAYAAKEIERRQEEERLRYYKPHDKQFIIHSSNKRLKVVTGGNRTGKSRSSAIETVCTCLGKDAEPFIQGWSEGNKKWWYKRFYNQPIIGAGVRAWCATESWDVQRDVMQENVLMYIPTPILAKCDIAYRKKGVVDFIVFPNKARLTFKSYETGWRGFQGASVDFIALDEEPPADVWNECEKRVMDRLGTIVITYTPLSGLTWSYDRLYMNVNNDPEVFHTSMTWDDNPYLNEQEKQRLLDNMPEDEREARVYGRYLIGGVKVFNPRPILARRDKVVPGNYYVYNNEREKFEYSEDNAVNRLEVFSLPDPRKTYVIGSDVAEGLPEGDNSVSCVGDVETMEQVAELVCARANATEFAKQTEALARWYNDAFILPERNNDGKAMLNTLTEILHYPFIFKGDDGEPGWHQTSRTRPLLIQKGQDAIKSSVNSINSLELLEECLTFVRNNRGKAQAAGKGTKSGKKDDRVFAWMLMLAAREMALLFGSLHEPVRPNTRTIAQLNNDPSPGATKRFARFIERNYAVFDEGGDED